MTLRERIEGLVAKWQGDSCERQDCEHDHCVACRVHINELAAVLAAEGPGDATCNCGTCTPCRTRGAAAPSLHKEDAPLQKVAAVNSSVSLAHSAFLSQQAAALHKEGAGGEPSEWKKAVRFCEEHLRAVDEDGCSCELHSILNQRAAVGTERAQGALGQELSDSIGAYALALARRNDGESTDDEEILAAISRCVAAKRDWDAAAAPAGKAEQETKP